jgi:hypothetical protein
MKLFTCQNCGQILYFENIRCERCHDRLGFLPGSLSLSALEPDDAAWRPLAEPGRRYRFCTNAMHGGCNWLVPDGAADTYCRACRHNRMIPDLSRPDNVLAWQKIEHAKHRLIYTLLRLGLPLANRADREGGLIFDFLADPPNDGPKVMTGHDNGLITIALAEADDVQRELRRTQMGEPYRTVLGHFRHEVGHYFWDRLVQPDPERLATYRAVFGDERRDYGEALQAYYAHGAPEDWQDRFISAYATAHPWEDFAETWAHYLHIVDTLEMAEYLGLGMQPLVDQDRLLTTTFGADPFRVTDAATLVRAWLPLTTAMNSLNRCMGASDPYPFILSPAVVGKLGFIHDLVRRPTTG